MTFEKKLNVPKMNPLHTDILGIVEILRFNEISVVNTGWLGNDPKSTVVRSLESLE